MISPQNAKTPVQEQGFLYFKWWSRAELVKWKSEQRKSNHQAQAQITLISKQSYLVLIMVRGRQMSFLIEKLLDSL